MKNDLIQIHNAATGEITVRELTNAEQKMRDAEKAQFLLDEEAAKAQATTLRETKILAYKKLGLSEAEIEALLPTPIEENA